jgi:hypothetical protein
MNIRRKIRKPIDEATLEKGARGAKDNYKLHTYYENEVIYSFLHTHPEYKELNKDSTLISHFEFDEKSNYLTYKKIIGHLFKKLSLSGNGFDKDVFTEQLKKETEKAHLHGWINPDLLPEIKVEYKNKSVSNGKAGSKKDTVQQIKPVVLLEVLKEMGVIDVADVLPNTTGEEFWRYKLISASSTFDFKTSVKTKNFIINNGSSPKANIFNDVYNSSKGYGSGSIGLISYLGAHGLFEDPMAGKDNSYNRYLRSVDYLNDKVLPNVPKELLFETLQNQEDTIELDNLSRLPFKKKGFEATIKEFLLFRGVSEETVDNLINKEKVYGGFFSQNSFEKGHKLHFNQMFFDLENANNEIVGSERFVINKHSDGGFKTFKLNTAKVAGNAFKIKGENPKLTVFTEAIVDAISEYELIKEAGLPVSNYNIFSVQGCGHLNNWFQQNLGFGFELNENFQSDYGRVFSVEKYEKKEKLSPVKKEKYIKSMSEFEFFYVSTGTENDMENLEKLKLLEKELNVKVSVIDKKYREEYIDYSKFNKEASNFLDSTNLDNFLKVNNLCFSYDSHDKEFSLKSYSVIYQKGKLNPSSVDKIKEVMIDKLGTCNIALAFDNDEAGLKYSVLSDYLREDLGITAYDSTPENIRKETDVNDILKSYNTLKVKNQEKALKLLENHMAKIEPDFECKKKVVKGNDCQIEKKNHRRP